MYCYVLIFFFFNFCGSLAVQCLGLGAPTARAPGLMAGRGPEIRKLCGVAINK